VEPNLGSDNQVGFVQAVVVIRIMCSEFDLSVWFGDLRFF